MHAVRCNTLWIGPRLGRVERACLRSVLQQGHPVSLYCYERPEGVPEGVELCDAAAVLPQASIMRHQGGSVALFANWFRYELQCRKKGIWLDTDIYLLAPLPDDRPILFGWQEPGLIATAVLKLPTDTPLLPPLLSLFEEREIPFWLQPDERLAAWLRRRLTGRTGLSRMPWGSAGPNAVTALAVRHGLVGEALPVESFYPIHHHDARWLLDPARSLDSMIAPTTIAIHLWNEVIKGFKDAPAPSGSFLHRLHEEGA
ncbi:MAG TPA: hypothetical protein VLK25_12160 [Allosphingosinicella sp.]|nr:hypothetical protein [Allosphingosinicella sp.]